jgi:hypothetical protein
MEENQIAYVLVQYEEVQYNVAVKALQAVTGQQRNLDFEIFIEGEHRYTIHPAEEPVAGSYQWSIIWPQAEQDNGFIQKVGEEIEKYYL